MSEERGETELDILVKELSETLKQEATLKKIERVRHVRRRRLVALWRKKWACIEVVERGVYWLRQARLTSQFREAWRWLEELRQVVGPQGIALIRREEERRWQGLHNWQ